MPYWENVSIMRDRMGNVEPYVCDLPVVKHFTGLKFHPKVTYFTGENGSGKSTLLEAIEFLRSDTER